MLNLLSAEVSQDGIEIASIIVSGFLSLILIGVTIANIVLNIKAMKDSSRFPIKTNLVNALLNYDSQFYLLCTKIINNKISDINYVEKSVTKLDDLNTELYEDIIKIKCAFPKNQELIVMLDNLYKESEYLCINMEKCKADLLLDVAKAWVNIEDNKIQHEFLIKDLLGDKEKFDIFIQGLHSDTIKFLENFVKVNQLLEKIDYQKFMNS